MAERYIGLMSGTSLDGVDAVLVRFDEAGTLAVEADAFVPFSAELRDAVLALQPVGADELARAALLANTLSRHYAAAVAAVLAKAGVASGDVTAVGCHGQTVRHAPQDGYTLQIVNGALLAERCGIDVGCDFRSRDIAAGGQGAPLVPAFHHECFAHPGVARAIVNIGGIANLTRLAPGETVTGFDSGPGNMLMDAWCRRHTGQPYDADGAWAASGRVDAALYARFAAEPYFAAPLPKSTGRDVFDLAWLDAHLAHHPRVAPADVQATLLELTAASIADAVRQHAPATRELYLCGGGALNGALVRRLAARLPEATVGDTAALGLPVHQVEAAAFAWLARRLVHRLSGNLPAVTGAAGNRVLGALYPR